MLVFALESGGSAYSWSSAPVLATLLASVVAFGLFLGWLLYIPRLNSTLPSLRSSPMLPSFPLHFLRRRSLAACFATGFFAGAPFTATLILLPQRLQLAHGLTPLQSGLRMLPLLLSSALGSGLGGVAAKYKRIVHFTPPFRLRITTNPSHSPSTPTPHSTSSPRAQSPSTPVPPLPSTANAHATPTYTLPLSGCSLALLLSSLLVLLGLSLESTVTSSTLASTIPGWEYFYLVILGLGFGTGLSSLVVLARLQVSDTDNAVLMASLTQVRVLGGCVGLAAGNAVLAQGTNELVNILSPGDLQRIMQNAATLGELGGAVREEVERVFAQAFRTADLALVGFAVVGVVASALAWTAEGRGLEDVAVGGERSGNHGDVEGKGSSAVGGGEGRKEGGVEREEGAERG